MRLTPAIAGLTLVVASAGLAACAASPGPASTRDQPSDAAMQSRAEYLAGLAASSGIDDPPDVALVRFVTSEEWAAVQIDCLADAGFEVSLLADGQGIDTTAIPELQRVKGGAFQLAQYTCEAMYTIDADSSGGLNDEELGSLYDWYVAVSVPCLEDEGIVVADPPSRQAFIDSYFTSDGWYPYGSVDVMGMDEDAWNDLNERCPQAPPHDVLYG